MHFTDLVDLACEFQNSFCGRGFTGINMGKNADIPILVQVCHGCSQLKKITKNLSLIYAIEALPPGMFHKNSVAFEYKDAKIASNY